MGGWCMGGCWPSMLGLHHDAGAAEAAVEVLGPERMLLLAAGAHHPPPASSPPHPPASHLQLAPSFSTRRRTACMPRMAS